MTLDSGSCASGAGYEELSVGHKIIEYREKGDTGDVDADLANRADIGNNMEEMSDMVGNAHSGNML